MALAKDVLVLLKGWELLRYTLLALPNQVFNSRVELGPPDGQHFHATHSHMVAMEFIEQLCTKHYWDHYSTAPKKTTIYHSETISPIVI